MPGWDHVIPEMLRVDWPDLGAESAATLVKSSDVRDVWRLTVDSRNVFVKQHRRPGPLGRVRQALVGPICKNEWDVARYAMRWEIPTAQPIAWRYK